MPGRVKWGGTEEEIERFFKTGGGGLYALSFGNGGSRVEQKKDVVNVLYIADCRGWVRALGNKGEGDSE